MQLTKIKYSSAVFGGAIMLVVYLLIGALTLYTFSGTGALPADIAAFADSITPVNLLLYMPVFMAVLGYLGTLLSILVYNIVAKKFPISWEIKK